MRFLDEDFMKEALSSEPAPYVQPGEGQGVSQTAAARIAGQSEALARLGIDAGEATTEAGYAIGTRALQDAVTGRLREVRIASLEMPPAIGALETLRDRARALRRETSEAPLIMLGADAETGFLLANGKGLNATPDAWGHLGQFYGAAGLGAYLPVAHPEIRAELVDHHAGILRDERAQALDAWRVANDSRKEGAPPIPPPDARKVALSSRFNLKGTRREVYRIASTAYAPFETEDACEALLASEDVRAALAGARAAVKWDGRRATLDLIWTADEKLYSGLGDFAAGDTFEYAQRITLDEVKGGSTEHYSYSRRNECLNMIIISTRRGQRESWRHVGESGQTVAGGLLSRIQSHRVAVDSFVGSWVGARRDRILDEMSLQPQQMFGALLTEGLIDLPGLRTVEKKVEALLSAFAKEPGQSLADVVNAATRAAHEGNWWNTIEAQEDAERDAGGLLYVKNLRAKIAAGLATYESTDADAVTA